MLGLRQGLTIRRGQRPSRRRGGAVLEMMLVLPILIMLTFGVIDYGYYFYVRTTLQGAASAAARAAVPDAATNSNVTSIVSNMMAGAGLQSSGYIVTLSPANVASAATGTPVTVTISANWGNVGTHMLGTVWGGISNAKTISASAAMLKE